MQIGNKNIGDSFKPHLIAEIGINHNGSTKQAIQLIDQAHRNGADSVKLQTFMPDSFLSKSSQYLPIFEKCHIKATDLKLLFDFALSIGIELFSSVFDMTGVEKLEKLNCSTYKVASGDLNHIPFLRFLSSLNKPLILSTGGATLDECERAINEIKNINEHLQISLLHCVSSYPANVKDLNLSIISNLKEKFNLPVGFSDHTIGTNTPMIAVAMGANIIEKHFTLDHNMEGPDHKLSANPDQLKLISSNMEEAFVSIGQKEKRPIETNDQIIAIRRSIVAKRKIAKGTIITEELISYKRPGDGLSPTDLDLIKGKIAQKHFQEEEQIKLKYLK